MLRIETVTVLDVIEETMDIQKLAVDGGGGYAILYAAFFPYVSKGDKVKINVTASDLKLGTGGLDIVSSIEERVSFSVGDTRGHIIKGRYLPTQHSMLTVESPEQKDQFIFYEKLNLHWKPILLCELHSMLPVVQAMYHHEKQEGKLVAVIDDSAALALPVSGHLQKIKEDRNVTTISIGQAFGGDFEAINLLTALQFAMHHYPEALIVVTVGPGVVGSGTRYGFSGIRMAEWANLIGKSKGVPVWTPRLSESDRRERHQGLSHHTKTALMEFTYAKSVLPVPAGELADRYIKADCRELSSEPHIKVESICERKVKALVEKALAEVSQIRSMGRSYEEDRLFFTGVGTALYWILENDQGWESLW
ncbi:DUF3866 family protein [Alteribacter keqinensis]|uniref:DUF3866 family protein n=1 Tax=Alteribacter keqinensis TaxID=2483800 RepID=A0A3M7TUW4_9BACI|nr:DUF3866 family protein [Alteribacter keqinensis]RNA69051.1 DUF3866 family protein [Alteribacter keqinensis]